MDPFSFAIASVASIGIGLLFPSSGPRMKDLKISASTYGATIPEAFGYARIAANMIWSDRIREHKKKKTVGLKTFKYYTYTCTFAMSVCQGPVSAVRRIWANHKLIYDATGKSEVTSKAKFKIRPYLGTEDQAPSSVIEALVGEGRTPAYRGQCYIVFEDMPLQDFGNTIPQVTVEVFAQGEAQTTANMTSFTRLPGNGINQDYIVMDKERGYLYNLDNDGGIHRYRMSTMTEEYVDPLTAYADALGGVSPITGNIVAFQDNLFGQVSIALHEPFGLTEVARTPAIGGGFSSPEGAVGSFSTDSAGGEYFMYSSRTFTEWCVIPTIPSFNFTTEYFKKVGSGLPNRIYGKSMVLGTHGEGAPSFYVWDGGSRFGDYVQSLNLWKVWSLDAGNTWDKQMIMAHPNPLPEIPGIQIGFEVTSIHMDLRDKCPILIWQENIQRYQIGKVDPRTGTFKWRREIAGYGNPQWIQSTYLADGQLMWLGSSRVYIIDTETGDFKTELFDPYSNYDDPLDVPKDVIAPPDANYAGIPLTGGTPIRESFYDETRRTIWEGNGPRAVKFGITSEMTTLAGFIERLLRRAGLSTRHFDLSGLAEQSVRGYGWASGSDLKSIIEQLQTLYQFDLIERNGKIVGVMRGTGSNEFKPGKPVRKLQQKVLGNSTGTTEGMDYWQETRLQEADIPMKVILTYFNWDDDFANSTAQSKRLQNPTPTMFSNQQLAMEIGVVLTATEAKNQVNKIIWSQWAERTKHDTRLPWAYLDLDPSDTVSVTMDDGRQYLERIATTEVGADFGIATESYSQDASAYVSSAIADGGGKGGADGIAGERPARAFVFNTPLLRDQDDTGGSYSLYYTGVGTNTPEAFDGAGFYRSIDNINYDLLYGTDTDVEWGQVTGRLLPARHGHFALDWENSVTIWPAVPWFELESITDDELWAGANLCVIGDEVLQFRDAVQNANGSWTIRNLLRGRRGTEYATTTHKVGESFVFLASTTITPEGELLDQRGQPRYFRAVAEGLALETALQLNIQYEPRDLMPYAPKDIRRSFAGDICTLTWNRRTRFGGNMQDGTGSVPLNEVGEQYEIYVLSGPFVDDLTRSDSVPANAIYTATTTEPTLTFNVSELTAPFDVDLDTLHVVIYQNSAAVGRGFPGTRSIQHWQTF